MFMNFGELIKQLRADRQLTLRQCCVGLGVDPSNWSKLERGLLPPPKHRDILERWAGFFDLAEEQKREFLDLAALGRGELPADLAADGRALAALPGFFQALRGFEPEPDNPNPESKGEPLAPALSVSEGKRVDSPQTPEVPRLAPDEVRQASRGNRLRSQALRRMLAE